MNLWLVSLKVDNQLKYGHEKTYPFALKEYFQMLDKYKDTGVKVSLIRGRSI